MDPVEMFEGCTTWASAKVGGVTADQYGAPTPCEDWDVRALLGHLTAGVAAIGRAARGEEPRTPEAQAGEDPVRAYGAARDSTSAALRADPGLLGRTLKMPFGESPAPVWLGIMGVDQLLHGWDLARATGQEAAMPAELAEAAWASVDGRLTDDRRGEHFKHAVAVPEGARAQDRLLGYTGRQP